MLSSKLKFFASNFVIITLSLIFIFTICEGVLRLKNFIIPNYDIEMWKYSKILKEKSDNNKIGHIHKKNKSTTLQGVKIKINNIGQRGKEIDIKKIDGYNRRILIIGGSVTLGWGVEEDKTLSNIIKKLSMKDNNNWIVFNGGIGNYNTQRYVNNYIENWQNLKITDLIIQFFVNDTEILKDNKVNFFTIHTHTGVMIWKFVNSLKPYLQSENIVNYYKKLYEDNFEGLKITKMELKKLKEHCDINKINCMIVLTPDIHKLNPYKLSFINKKIKTIASDLEFKYYDLLPSFKNIDEKKIWNKYNDPHPNEIGHRIMGEAIYGFLKK